MSITMLVARGKKIGGISDKEVQNKVKVKPIMFCRNVRFSYEGDEGVVVSTNKQHGVINEVCKNPIIRTK